MTISTSLFKSFIILNFIASELRFNCNANNSLQKNLSARPSNRKNSNNSCTALVVWGTNLGSTTKYGRFTKVVREMIVLPFYHESIVVGLLLSDGWLSLSQSNTVKNARLGFKQSLDKFEYVWFVFNVLSHYCERYPYTYSNIRGGKIHPSITITTRALPCFTLLYNIFYIDNKKVIPSNIYNILTPVALAHLIMGDGTYRGGGIRLCTDSYSLQDVVRLINVLIIRYRLNPTVHTDRGRYRIYIPKNSMLILIPVVKPHMVPSMLYKLGI